MGDLTKVVITNNHLYNKLYILFCVGQLCTFARVLSLLVGYFHYF